MSRVRLEPEQPLSDRPTFLAPLIQSHPRPVQEQLSYTALGGAATPVQLATVGDNPAVAAVAKDMAVTEKVGGGDDKVASEAHAAEELPVFSEIEVDSAASRDPESAGPVYPPTLMAKGIEGSVLATFVVDTSGRPDVGTYIALEATHTLFGNAVREALPRMKFRPAKRGNVPVRQQVELRFSFRVVKPPVVAPKRPATPTE
jgi:protein TonB